MADAAAKTVPGRHGLAITPSDTTVIPQCRAVYVGGTGDLVVTHRDDLATTTYKAVPAGSLLPLDVRLIMAATTATNITVTY